MEDGLWRKEWYTAVDELVCPVCRALHGTIVPVDKKFPGGFDGPPAHDGCRCNLLPVGPHDEGDDLGPQWRAVEYDDGTFEWVEVDPD
jgi:hypothetical protein